MTLYVADTYKLTENPQTVTYTSRPASGDVTDSVPYASRLAISRSEVLGGGGLYSFQDVVWLLPVTELTYTPQEGDLITEADGTIWTVLTWQKTCYDTQWRLVCRRARS